MQIDIILLECVPKLGQMGEIVRVKSGYARNFLIPQKKALRATEKNKIEFENKRIEIETSNLESRQRAESMIDFIKNRQIIIIRQASESGQLYGSVSAKDIADALSADGLKIKRYQVFLQERIKMLGVFDIVIQLHPEVSTLVKLNVAKSQDEANMQWDRYKNGEPILTNIIYEKTLKTNSINIE